MKPDEKQVLKSFDGLEIKDAEKGEVEAVIATYGVVDKDEDVIQAGAIADGSKVLMSRYGHDVVYGNAPVGKGTITRDGNKAIFKGRIFLTTDAGRETFAVLKEVGADQNWSFGFRILGAEVPDEDQRKSGARRILTKLDAFEVSPVVIGAGVGTRTVAVKAADPVVDPAVESAQIEAKRKEDEAAEATRVETEAKAEELARLNADAERIFSRRPKVA